MDFPVQAWTSPGGQTPGRSPVAAIALDTGRPIDYARFHEIIDSVLSPEGQTLETAAEFSGGDEPLG